jgi:hypothetical protein
LYEVGIEHVRTEPLRHAFHYSGYQWLVDLDAIPRLRWPLRLLATFDARDHLGRPDRGIRENVDAFLAEHDIALPGGRIVMLSQPCVLGYVFNPLTVFWCYAPDGTLTCTLAEVHNTYGQRHCYLLQTDERGRAATAKEFYVSPFYPVAGEYRMTMPEPGDRLDVTIALHRHIDPGDVARPFVARMHGHRVAYSRRALLRLVARHPVAPLLGAVRIRRQGIGLWCRGLRPFPRPDHHQEGVS